jgi:hypothetical protein
MKLSALVSLAVLLITAFPANAQIGDAATYGNKNTYSVFTEYSNDSSHIVLGRSPDRKFASLGVQYERRLVANHLLVWRYAAEFRPLILESDPTASDTITTLSPPPTSTINSGFIATGQCNAEQITASYPPDPITGVSLVYELTVACGRRWTFAQGLSPFGTRINLRPHHKLQPTGSILAGYMFSTKPIPIDSAGSFNFTFEFGAGLELFQSHSRSLRLEYQIQHFSNAYSASSNPGVDNGLFKLTYNFGR